MNESPRLVWLLSTPACMGDPGGFGHCQLFFLFLTCSCDKAHLLPKERDSLCLWIAICVFNISCRRIWLEMEKKQICLNPPPCMGGFGHGRGEFGHN